jgi:hypothetical protein
MSKYSKRISSIFNFQKTFIRKSVNFNIHTGVYQYWLYEYVANQKTEPITKFQRIFISAEKRIFSTLWLHIQVWALGVCQKRRKEKRPNFHFLRLGKKAELLYIFLKICWTKFGLLIRPFHSAFFILPFYPHPENYRKIKMSNE